jgi:hypothetical protein
MLRSPVPCVSMFHSYAFAVWLKPRTRVRRPGSLYACSYGSLACKALYHRVPKFSPYGKRSCACAQNAWLAASVWLRLARKPPPASRVRRSRRLRDTLAAAPGLLAHACVTEAVKLCRMGPKLRHTVVTPSPDARMLWCMMLCVYL